AGLSQAIDVTQEQRSLIIQPGNKVDLSCEHDDTSGTYNMYWYQQRSGHSLKLIAMSIGLSTPTVEKEFEGHWTMSKEDAKRSSLRKDKAEAQDTAVYFCASSIT
ncbi:hypothetical protein GDO81_024624, partial [Engystomops pustulosus]